MSRRKRNEEDRVRVDEDGDFILTLVTNSVGRSALDVAEDPDCTQEEVQTIVQEERAALSKLFGYRYSWSILKATRKGKLTALRRLLETGADIQPKPQLYEREDSPVRVASKRGNYEMVKYLLEAYQPLITQAAYTPESLEAAVERGDQAEVTRLVEAQTFLKRYREHKNRALRDASGNGRLALVQLLVSHGAETEPLHEDHRPYVRPSALELAAKNGHIEMVQYLLNQGVIGHNETNGSYTTGLKYASQSGYLDVVELLLKAGADLNVDNAIHAAAFGGHLKILNPLLEAGAGVDTSNEYENSYREGHLTALQEATRGGHLEVSERLLQVGADVNALTRERGYTALQGAAKSGSVELVQRLLAAGAYVNAPAEDYARTALQAAAEIGSLEIVNILLAAGANIETFVPGTCNSRTLAVRLAVEKGHLTVAERLLEEIVNTEYEPSPHLLKVTLGSAASGGNEQLVRQLIEIGAPLTANDQNQPLVNDIAGRGYTAIMALLLDAEAAMDSKNSYHTSLQRAVMGDHLDTVRLLLDRGADVNAAPNRLKPPLPYTWLAEKEILR